MMQTIKYKYALNSSGETVNIESLIANTQVRSEQFRCLSCDNILIPVLGHIRQKHFRHKVEIQCSSETYLHKLAKQTFYEVYNSCLLENIPFWIEINFTRYCSFYEQELLVPCTFSKGKQKFDLTQYFTSIKLETKDGSFIPDLLLISEKGEKIFVEIAVTHKSTTEKIQLKQRIIELNIRSEIDINTIKKFVLKESKDIYFFNFKRQEKKNFCQGKCINGFQPRVKYKNNVTLKIGALSEKSCFLCQHHRIIVYKGKDIPIYCQIFKQRFHQKAAYSCQDYLPDDKFIDNLYLIID